MKTTTSKSKPSTKSRKQSEATSPPVFAGQTHICFVLDKSGSMGSCRDEAISGFNEYVEQQKQLEDNTTLTLVLFDSTVVTPIVDTKMADVRPIGKHDYVPNGCTALFDAVGRSIALTEPKVKKEDRVLVVILTDGLENASQQIRSHEQIRDVITMKEREGNWTFTYMGSGENWQQEVASMGIAAANSIALDPTNVKGSVGIMARATMSYRGTMSARSANFYSGSSGRHVAGDPLSRPLSPPTTRSSARPVTVHSGNPFSLARSTASASTGTDLQELLSRASKR